MSMNPPRTPRARSSYKAWVVRWESADAHAAVEQPVAAIVSPRLRGRQVRVTVELLHAVLSYTPDEMLAAARQHNAHNPYPAKFGTVSVNVRGERLQVPWEGEVICGHNPWLAARKARVWPLGDGSGNVRWEDDPRPTSIPAL